MARSGDLAGACRVLRAMDPNARIAQRALLFGALGDRDSMYATFERAIDTRGSDTIWILNATPILRPLRHEPRYQTLLGRMRLPEHLRR